MFSIDQQINLANAFISKVDSLIHLNKFLNNGSKIVFVNSSWLHSFYDVNSTFNFRFGKPVYILESDFDNSLVEIVIPKEQVNSSKHHVLIKSESVIAIIYIKTTTRQIVQLEIDFSKFDYKMGDSLLSSVEIEHK